MPVGAITSRCIDGQEASDLDTHVEPADEHHVAAVHGPSADDRAEVLEYLCAYLCLAAAIERHGERIFMQKRAATTKVSS